VIDMQASDIQGAILPVITDMNFELVGVRSSGQGRHAALRIYVDTPGGINVDDLTKGNRQVRDDLRVAGYDVDGTTREDSSPGVNRPLFTLEHFQRFLESRVKIQMHIPINGQRSFTGLLKSVEGEAIVLEINDETVELPYGDIAKANLHP